MVRRLSGSAPRRRGAARAGHRQWRVPRRRADRHRRSLPQPRRGRPAPDERLQRCRSPRRRAPCRRDASPAVANLFGWPVEEVVGTPITDRIHPEDHHAFEKLLAADPTLAERVGELRSTSTAPGPGWRWRSPTSTASPGHMARSATSDAASALPPRGTRAHPRGGSLRGAPGPVRGRARDRPSARAGSTRERGADRCHSRCRGPSHPNPARGRQVVVAGARWSPPRPAPASTTNGGRTPSPERPLWRGPSNRRMMAGGSVSAWKGDGMSERTMVGERGRPRCATSGTRKR